MVYGTDGGIAPSGLVVLQDDKGVQPVYQPAPIIREAVLKQYPQIKDLLAPVFAKLDLVTLQTLNGQIQVVRVGASASAPRSVVRVFDASHSRGCMPLCTAAATRLASA